MSNNKKSTPSIIHVRSKGKKSNIFQKIIRSENYYLVPLTGEIKTDLFNKGIVDGRKKPIQLYIERTDFSRFYSFKWILAIEKHLIDAYVSADMKFTYKLALSKTYLLYTNEINLVEEKWCPLCEECGVNEDYLCSKVPRKEFVLGSKKAGGKLGRWVYG